MQKLAQLWAQQRASESGGRVQQVGEA
jgi:hypothetical protein